MYEFLWRELFFEVPFVLHVPQKRYGQNDNYQLIFKSGIQDQIQSEPIP
jgi:hypothetical protein